MQPTIKIFLAVKFAKSNTLFLFHIVASEHLCLIVDMKSQQGEHRTLISSSLLLSMRKAKIGRVLGERGHILGVGWFDRRLIGISSGLADRGLQVRS
jgi:hypothetical protein